MYYSGVDMIFELNTSFDQLRLWRRKYSLLWTRLNGRKNPERNSKRYQQPDEVRASRYLTLKNNKITVEEEEQHIGNLGKFCSERKASRQKWLTILCFSGRRKCIAWYLCSSNWDIVSYTKMILPPLHSFKLHACSMNTWNLPYI